MLNRQAHRDAEAARGLGWASIGIGLAEIAATLQVEAMLGLEDNATHRGILRTLGVREIMHGVGILTEKRPNEAMATGVCARVAGDVLDSALLGVAAMKTKRPASFAAVTASVMVIGALDLLYSLRLKQHQHSYA